MCDSNAEDMGLFTRVEDVGWVALRISSSYVQLMRPEHKGCKPYIPVSQISSKLTPRSQAPPAKYLEVA